MKYTSCFIGIPLPQDKQAEFAILISDLQAMELDLRCVNPTTPHITLYYLDEQSQYHLEEIAEIVNQERDVLASASISIHELGVFNPEQPRVLYLQADCSPEVEQSNHIFRNVLHEYYAIDNNVPFHPHMTIARIPNNESRSEFHKNRMYIESLCNQINWKFPVTDIVIYGVDSTQDPESQQQLFSFKVSD